MAKKRMTKAEWAAFREQMLVNAAHTRELAEKGLSDLRKNARPQSQS
jgi:hypothetical protein